MSFDAPWRLLAGALVAAALVWLYRRAESRVDAQALRYSNLTFLAGALRPRAWVPRALRAGWALALLALAVGAAGPHLTLPVPVADGNVFICIDTSGSMASSDVMPTRAQAATAAARAFIQEAPPGVKIGIIAFSDRKSVV